MTRRVVAVVVAAVTLLGGGLTGGAPAAQAVQRPAVQLQTPVLSLRRVPALLADTVGQVKLGGVLDAAMADPSLGPARTSSCLVVQQGGVTVYSRQPTTSLIPGSNLKLLTGTAALDKLGPQARLVTDVRADHPAAGGVINGNLYLVGGGDPLLRTADYVATLHYRELLYTHLEDLAQAVATAGVHHVTGSVVGDESRYDTLRYVPSWRNSYAAGGDVGPISALQVNDGYAAWHPRTVAATQPAQQAAAVLTGLLKARGVAVDGPPGQANAPAGAASVTSLPSAPLSDVVAEVLRQSNNDGAELLTKELGRQGGGGPTTAGGVAAIRAALQADGLPVDQLTMVDGSGLDRSDRVTCQLLVGALQHGGPTGPLGAGLPIAGQTGTLQFRMLHSAATGRLHAKTGSLEGVSSLSGFVLPAPADAGAPAPGASGQSTPLTFSLIFNGNPTRPAAEAVEDHIGALLAGFPQAPPVAQLSPLPPVGG